MAAADSIAPPGEPGFRARLGEACVRAVAVTALASVPGALRTAAAGGSVFDGILVGASVLLPLVTLAIVLARAAGRGFRYIVGKREPRVVVLGLALWTGLALPALVGLGSLLKAHTHHHGLGGVTFGVLGLTAVAIAGLVALRLMSLGQHLLARGVRPAFVAFVGAAVAVVPMMLAAAPLGRYADGGTVVRAAIMDGAIVLVATALAASLELKDPWKRRAGLFGIPIAAIVMLAAGARIETRVPVAKAFKAGGGLAPSLLGVLERWTDRDGDGEGSHFGGCDCDDGDPGRRSQAREIPGDGIDQDCDGIDPPAVVVRPIAREKSGVPAVVAPAQPARRSDIVLVTLDTVGADHTSAYAYAKPTTPNLAELARRGVLFEHAYATGSDTQRALGPLVSGRRLHETPHDKREWPTLLPEVDTLAERLKRSGYRTAAVTSFTWLSEERGFSQGFDWFEPVHAKAHPEREVTGRHAVNAAKGLLQKLQADSKPFFLWVHLFDAHDRYLSHPGIKLGKGRVGAYDGEVAFVDQMLGEIVKAIKGMPRGEQAAFLVHGSHGEAFGEHDAMGHGNDLYEEVLRVPLVLVLPGGQAARYSGGTVSTLDIAPTIADLGGASAEGMTGRSLVPIGRGDFARKLGPVYARSQKRVALIDWPLKLIWFERSRSASAKRAPSHQSRRERTLLFDLSTDPEERTDLSSDRPGDVARMLKARGAFERLAQ